eukprot:12894929-Prorocentrum_lima.AAC.1
MAVKSMMDLLDSAKHSSNLSVEDAANYTKARKLYLSSRGRTGKSKAQLDEDSGVREASVDAMRSFYNTYIYDK